MEKIKKVFGEINLTWAKLIIFAVISGAYTAIIAMLPIAKDTSFSDIAVTFEVWILFGIFIIMNSKSAKDSALKCFVFFLISQPLVYLIQVPFSEYGWQLFQYYKYWFIWTLCTLPMGFLGWYMKKDKWWGLIILIPILALLGEHFGRYLATTFFTFPKHLLTTIFCAVTMIAYPLVIFKDKKIKIIGVLISIIILITFSILMKPSKYDTILLVNGGSEGVNFDDSYKATLLDETFGTLDIRLEPGIDDWAVHAVFNKTGNTEVILEATNGEKEVFSITIENNSYNITKK